MEEYVSEFLKLLSGGGKSKREILNSLEMTALEFTNLKNKLRDDGFGITYNRKSQLYEIGGVSGEDLSENEKIIKDFVEKRNLSASELESMLKGISKPQKKAYQFSQFEDLNKVTVGLVSDTHFGSSYFNERVFMDSVVKFKEYNVDAIYHAGDVLEGMSNRDGHIYELDRIGVSDQMGLAVEMLGKYDAELFLLTGNHDEWAMKKGNQGFRVGPTLEQSLDNAKFIGEMRADIKLGGDGGIDLRVSHEGNSSYALSYSGQKRINALSGGQKPHVIFNGHLHKALYMFYRNIHFFESATTQSQTGWMQMKGSPAHLGFWVNTIEWDSEGVRSITPRYFPHFE